MNKRNPHVLSTWHKTSTLYTPVLLIHVCYYVINICNSLERWKLLLFFTVEEPGAQRSLLPEGVGFEPGAAEREIVPATCI